MDLEPQPDQRTILRRVRRTQGDVKPVDIDAIEVGGKMLYSIIWVENTPHQGWAEFRDMTPESYGQKFDEYPKRAIALPTWIATSAITI